MNRSCKLILADDHAILRKSLRYLLHGVSDYSIVGEACNAGELESLIETISCDYILMDLCMLQFNGLEFLEARKAFPSRENIIVFTQSKCPRALRTALSCGVSGYILKDEPVDTIREALDYLRQGGRNYVSPRARAMLFVDDAHHTLSMREYGRQYEWHSFDY